MKPVVSKRNHFTSAAELVDMGIPRVPDELKHPNLAAWLLSYTEMVIRYIQFSFATAATRGIEQASALICDPDFYEHRKESRRKFLKRWRDQEAAQNWDRMQRESCPTAEQIQQEIAWIDRKLAYHQGQIEKHQGRLKELHAKTPLDVEKRSSKALQ